MLLLFSIPIALFGCWHVLCPAYSDLIFKIVLFKRELWPNHTTITYLLLKYDCKIVCFLSQRYRRKLADQITEKSPFTLCCADSFTVYLVASCIWVVQQNVSVKRHLQGCHAIKISLPSYYWIAYSFIVDELKLTTVGLRLVHGRRKVKWRHSHSLLLVIPIAFVT